MCTCIDYQINYYWSSTSSPDRASFSDYQFAGLKSRNPERASMLQDYKNQRSRLNSLNKDPTHLYNNHNHNNWKQQRLKHLNFEALDAISRFKRDEHHTNMIPFSWMVSRIRASLPSTRSFFLTSYDIAKTSASLDRSAINLPITLHALLSVREGNVFLRSLAFVVATDTTLLVPLCITFACTNLFEKNTFSRKGLRYISVLCFHDFLLGFLAASLRDLLVQAAWTTNPFKDSHKHQTIWEKIAAKNYIWSIFDNGFQPSIFYFLWIPFLVFLFSNQS